MWGPIWTPSPNLNASRLGAECTHRVGLAINPSTHSWSPCACVLSFAALTAATRATKQPPAAVVWLMRSTRTHHMAKGQAGELVAAEAAWEPTRSGLTGVGVNPAAVDLAAHRLGRPTASLPSAAAPLPSPSSAGSPAPSSVGDAMKRNSWKVARASVSSGNADRLGYTGVVGSAAAESGAHVASSRGVICAINSDARPEMDISGGGGGGGESVSPLRASCRGSLAASGDDAAGGELLAGAAAYCDPKVANRENRVWHFVIENGY
jgi:hypothetical protein